MSLVAKRLNLRLFIDGIEVPVIGAKCTFAEGAPATAQVQVVATDQVYDLTPRSFVTLFVYDSFDYVDDPVTGEANAIRLGPHDLRRWKLLFSGELVSIGMNKQASGRSATISCADTTNYWDFIRQHYINFSNGGVELFEAAFLGVKQDRLKFFDVVTQGVHSKLYTWLVESKNADGNSSLYLGIQRMLREMFFSVNDFYAEAFNRLRIGDTIVGLSQDETAAKLFKIQFAEKFIKNQVGGAGGMLTARQLVDSLLGPVFHTYVTVPFPRFDRTGASKGFKPDPNKQADSDLAQGIIDRSQSWPDACLNQTIIKPDTWFLAPPDCNVVFPHQYRSVSFSRNYLAEPTRMFLRTSLIFTGQDKWLTERFYAPDFKVFNDLLYKKGGYLKRMSETLLPHERFVGINPAQVWQSDLTAYVQKGQRREYLSKLTDYLYWKYKFGTRTVNVSGPLNLNLVPGYPGLVMDRVSTNFGSTRHFLGNISTIVHSVDQTGGWTHFSMVGARVHDEKIDYDEELNGTAQSLEEITSRGTDGFLDDRYDVNRIGPEVYQQLFGCGSIVDRIPEAEQFDEVTTTEQRTVTRPRTSAEQAQIDNLQNEINRLQGIQSTSTFVLNERDAEIARLTEELSNVTARIDSARVSTEEVPVTNRVRRDLVPQAVDTLNLLYRAAVQGNVDIVNFTNLITNRPKANFAEVMGINLQNVPPSRNEVDEAVATSLSLELLRSQDAALSANEGFFATAVDPTALVTSQNSYIASTTRVVTKTTLEEEVVVPERTVFDPVTGAAIDVPEVTQQVEKVTQERQTETVTGKYALTENLNARREKVEAYVGSLLLRGLRG